MLKHKKNKKIVVVCILFITVITVFIFNLNSNNNVINDSSIISSETQSDQYINYDPPTEDEQKSGDNKKNELSNQPDPELPKTANVIISDASQYNNEIEVRAFVNNVIKDGTCTFSFTKDSLKLNREMPAKADATTTPCLALTIPLSEFTSKGLWNLRVTYENGELTGTSSTTLEVK